MNSRKGFVTGSILLTAMVIIGIAAVMVITIYSVGPSFLLKAPKIPEANSQTGGGEGILKIVEANVSGQNAPFLFVDLIWLNARGKISYAEINSALGKTLKAEGECFYFADSARISSSYNYQINSGVLRDGKVVAFEKQDELLKKASDFFVGGVEPKVYKYYFGFCGGENE